MVKRQELFSGEGAPHFIVTAQVIGENNIENLITCKRIEDTWYGFGLGRDDGIAEWEGAGYRHPTLPYEPETLCVALGLMKEGKISIPVWEDFAGNYILFTKRRINNGVPPEIARLEFIAVGDKPYGMVNASSALIRARYDSKTIQYPALVRRTG